LTGVEFHALCRAAWDEFKLAAGRRRIVAGVHGVSEPPRWFVSCELGEGICTCERCKPDPARLSMSFVHWRLINAEILAFLFDSHPPPPSEHTNVSSACRGDGFEDVLARAWARLAEAS
jgi:hypothetical protein